jgi:(2Fe-2S) ferredoxin
MPKPLRHVLVCTNRRPADNPKGCCADKGSEALLDKLKALARERGLDGKLMIVKTGCLKHCSQGSAVAVYPDNVWYAKVGVDDAEAIVTEHLEQGRPLVRLSMPDIPWE